jgi:ferredoxin-NADP reductase
MRTETASARTLVLDVDGWTGHLPGQHVDLRLTAEDGYSTQRSYSLGAPENGERIELTIQRLADGEVSPFLTDELLVGDEIELRGPVGGWFVWTPDVSDPVLLVAGGSGVVPLMAMLRARRQSAATTPFRLVYSVRTPADAFYGAELAAADGEKVDLLYTRSAPPGALRPASRLSRADLADLSWSGGVRPRCYVCGPTGFVEAVASLLLDLGHDPAHIRTERFGPSGG